MNMSVVLAGYARTPFVKFMGVFANVSAVELGAHAMGAALTHAGVSGDQVDAVIAGHVLQGGLGQNTARQSAVAAGIPLTTTAITINAVCLSGTQAVADAVRLINAGDASIVVVVGQESMTNAPHVLPGSRKGTKYGAIELIDTMEFDGLTDAFQKRSMGISTEDANTALGLTRAEQDEVAAASHQRSVAHAEFVAGEITPLTVSIGRTETVIAADDGVRADTTVDSLGKLRPAFSPDGTITAGNSSQISDGAAALVLMSSETAATLGVSPIAEVLATAFVAGPDVTLHSQPANAIAAAAARAGISASDLVAIEINEAFAAVSVQSTKDLGVSAEIVNATGGAIAIGHPIGASGTRIVGHLARRLAREGAGSLGAAGICGGGGQGSAVILRSL
jgi:acetyl-CoA C-acetyltransferase